MLDSMLQQLGINPGYVAGVAGAVGFAKNNPDVMLKLLKFRGSLLQYTGDKIKNNPKIVLAALQQDITALQYADIRLQSDPVLLQAAKINYSFLYQTISALAVSATVAVIGILILTIAIALPVASTIFGGMLAITGLVATGFFAIKLHDHKMQVETLLAPHS